MKITGIVAEYNPLHNGHVYQMEQARAITGAEYLVAVMSGNFTQRGEPAVFDKYLRTAAALEAGADLVVELPAAFACAAAQDFACCAAALLDKLGCVDFICFGSESGDLDALSSAAELLNEEPDAYVRALKNGLKSGLPFPKARSLAFLSLFPSFDGGVLSSPNDILGIEYLRALMGRRSPVKPAAVKRLGNGYHAPGLSGRFSSAAAIRKAIGGTLEDLRRAQSYVPEPVKKLIESGPAVTQNDFSLLLNQRLLELTYREEPFSRFADVSGELSRRLERAVLTPCSFQERILQLKTRQYTYTRISRALLHLLLGITGEDMERFRALDYAPYARVLGFRQSAAPVLSQIKKEGRIPLITKVADAAPLLSPGAAAMLRMDLHASHLYQAVVRERYGAEQKNEFNRGLIIL